ncbi:MAG: hypothetical protein ACR2NN_04160 [Bryobacteraceae bacterium]
MALTQEFWQITLPLMTTGLLAMLGTMTTIIVTASGANKRIDDLGKRIDDLGNGMGARIDDLGSGMGARIDDLRSDMNRQFGVVNSRLQRIEDKLDSHENRIVLLEERTSPIQR